MSKYNAVVILPTYNEAENLKELIPKLRQYDVDVLVVDDSPTSETARVAEELGAAVLNGQRRGRTAALVEGIEATTHPKVVTMDADLQHPPEVVPRMVDALTSYDVVVASRNAVGGRYVQFGWRRKIVSYVAKLLAWPLAPKVRDRSSGYVAFRRDVLNGAKLNLRGFSTLELGILVKGTYNTVVELPYSFGLRVDGTSKLTTRMMLDHLMQLARFYLYKFQILRFALVGASGAVLGLGYLWALRELAGLNYLHAYAISFGLSLTSNYVLNSLWTFGSHQGVAGWFRYALACSPTFAVSMTLMYLLTGLGGLWYMLSAVILIFVAFLINYLLSKRFVWARR